MEGERATTRILRLPAVMELTGLSRSSIWRREKQGEFPKRVSLGSRFCGFFEDEVVAWIEEQRARRDRTSG